MIIKVDSDYIASLKDQIGSLKNEEKRTYEEKQHEKRFLQNLVHPSFIFPKTDTIKYYHQENRDSFDFADKSNTHNGSEEVILMKTTENSQVHNPGFPHLLKVLESPKLLKCLLDIPETPRISTKFGVSLKKLKFLMDDQYSFLYLVYSSDC